VFSVGGSQSNVAVPADATGCVVGVELAGGVVCEVELLAGFAGLLSVSVCGLEETMVPVADPVADAAPEAADSSSPQAARVIVARARRAMEANFEAQRVVIESDPWRCN
jgi:hypothetical protein